MNRTDIIQKFIDKYKFKSYLEIGVNNGVNFNKIKIKHKDSVDPALGQYINANPTYKMTSNDFFEKYTDKMYDIIFIDGLHESEQVTQDINNSINSLSSGGVIILHDCNPLSEQAQTVPRQSKIWNGDVWKSLVKFAYTNGDNYNVFTIDTDHGCGVIMEGKTDINYDMPPVLDYNWLKVNRTSSLNLITVNDFIKLMNTI
jgi:hypothetical protein